MVDQINLDALSVVITDYKNTCSINLQGIDNIIKFFEEEKKIWSLNKKYDEDFNNYSERSDQIISQCIKLKKTTPTNEQVIDEFIKNIEELSKNMCFSHSRLGETWIEEYKISNDRGKMFSRAVDQQGLPSDKYKDIVPYFKGLFAIEFEKNFKEAIGYDQKEINNQISKATSTINNHGAMIKKHESILTNLEESYKTKLHLEEPVQLWERRTKKLANEKRIWILLLILSISIFIWLVQSFLYHPPKIVENLTKFTEPNTIKILIIIITTISLFGFLIAFFAKLAYSAYHLQRDAEERKVLTDYYLSMLMRGDIKREETTLIIQSLFSRADTGLLKGDSSPAMPSSMIEKLIEAFKNR